jgi:hypothetical protein
LNDQQQLLQQWVLALDLLPDLLADAKQLLLAAEQWLAHMNDQIYAHWSGT